MLKSRVKIINQLGLHARAAAQLVRLAGTFNSDIKIFRVDNQASADAKSILNVLTLAAGKGLDLDIQVSGEDEQKAMREIESLFNNGFGEL